jgi:endonuclease I
MKITNKYTLALLGLIMTIGAVAQPLTYYQDAWNENGNDLREALYDIIKVHTKLPYSSSSTDTWDVLKASDVDPANSSNVILIYAGISVNGPQEYNGGSGWNREHVWPRSLGNFGTSTGVGTDVHNLKPATISLNSTRSNHEFDYLGTSGNAVSYGGNTTGNRLNASAGLWEPRDDVKGDLARIIMYMDLRYEGAGSEPDLVMREALNTGGTTFAVMSTLLTWHFQDTVDQFELNRNNVIANLQGNRNPFIDHPELAHYLYGDSVGVVWNPFLDIEKMDDVRSMVNIHPNPASNELFLTTSFAGRASLINVKGQRFEFKLEEGMNRWDVSSIPAGQYILEFSDGTKQKVLINH